jgi:hypothetical protein
MDDKELPITMEDDKWITAEAVLNWVHNILAIVGAAAILVLVLGYLGYSSVKTVTPVVADKCINSACEGKPCGSRFKRHEGCEK